MPKTLRGLLATAQHAFTVLGLTAVAIMFAIYMRPELAHDLAEYLAPEEVVVQVQAPDLADLMEAPAAAQTTEAAAAPLTAEEKAMLGNKKQQQFVTTWLSKRYRVAGDAANMLVATTYLTARDLKIDPLLVLAVMAIESGFNPFAESPMGAQGLMQVMSKVHSEKFQDLGGTQAALNPVANIRVGAQILKEYVSRGGSVEAGLKTYVGAAAFETDSGYGYKVLAEYRRLKQVAGGKNVPTFTPQQPAPVTAATRNEVPPVAVVGHEQIAGL